MSAPVAFLFDVDDTLLDNDRFEADLRAWLQAELGAENAARYASVFEARRQSLGYADFLGTLQQCWADSRHDPAWLPMEAFILDYPFAERLYPDTLDVLRYCSRLGPTWLITDGDGIMQPRKLRRAGLWDAVGGHVRVYTHKERMLDEIRHACPASHYVLTDDKLRILDAVKRQWRAMVTTVWPKQGHYAAKAATAGAEGGHLSPDLVLSRIGRLVSDPEIDAMMQRLAAQETDMAGGAEGR